jgi:hypothetical protein
VRGINRVFSTWVFVLSLHLFAGLHLGLHRLTQRVLSGCGRISPAEVHAHRSRYVLTPPVAAATMAPESAILRSGSRRGRSIWRPSRASAAASACLAPPRAVQRAGAYASWRAATRNAQFLAVCSSVKRAKSVRISSPFLTRLTPRGEAQPCRCSHTSTNSSMLIPATPIFIRCGGKIAHCNVPGVTATT